MRHDHNNRPISEIRPRRLPYVAALAALALPAIALIGLHKDITVNIGVPVWMATSTVTMALLCLVAWKLLQPRSLMTITPHGISLPRIINGTLRWSDIKKVEAATRRGQTGDIHDRLVIHLKKPMVIDWLDSRLRRTLGDTPQIAIAVDIGFQWPSRAADVKRIIRDAARTYADAPSLRSDTPLAAKSRSRLVPALFMLLACSLPAASYVYDIGLPRMFSEGLDLYRDGNIGEAIPYLEKDARAGDAEAAFALGNLYLNGDGVDRNLSMSAGWFLRAADKGHAEAAYRLGNASRLGLGVPQNISQALSWYQQASDGGAVEAAYTLGRLYRLGDGVRRDYTQALTWLQRAADQGFAPAEHELGQLYQEGIAVPRNTDTARHWLSEAASKGHAPARYDLARLLLDGDASSRQDGLAILQLAANNGYAPAQRRLAAIYFKGQNVTPDPITAYQWIALAERSWPATTRADLVREKARIAATLDAASIAEAKSRIRNWRPIKK